MNGSEEMIKKIMIIGVLALAIMGCSEKEKTVYKQIELDTKDALEEYASLNEKITDNQPVDAAKLEGLIAQVKAKYTDEKIRELSQNTGKGEQEDPNTYKGHCVALLGYLPKYSEILIKDIKSYDHNELHLNESKKRWANFYQSRMEQYAVECDAADDLIKESKGK
jgi:hypothetical protein